LDPVEVRSALGELRAALEDAERRERLARVRAETAERKLREVDDLDADELTMRAGRRTVAVLEAARTTADEIEAEARAVAESLRADADAEARRVREGAKDDRRRLLRETTEAHAVATKRGEELVAQARETAKRDLEAARDHADMIVGEARLVRDRIAKDLIRRRREAQRHFEELRTLRDEFEGRLDEVERLLADGRVTLGRVFEPSAEESVKDGADLDNPDLDNDDLDNDHAFSAEWRQRFFPNEVEHEPESSDPAAGAAPHQPTSAADAPVDATADTGAGNNADQTTTAGVDGGAKVFSLADARTREAHRRNGEPTGSRYDHPALGPDGPPEDGYVTPSAPAAELTESTAVSDLPAIEAGETSQADPVSDASPGVDDSSEEQPDQDAVVGSATPPIGHPAFDIAPADAVGEQVEADPAPDVDAGSEGDAAPDVGGDSATDLNLDAEVDPDADLDLRSAPIDLDADDYGVTDAAPVDAAATEPVAGGETAPDAGAAFDSADPPAPADEVDSLFAQLRATVAVEDELDVDVDPKPHIEPDININPDINIEPDINIDSGAAVRPEPNTVGLAGSIDVGALLARRDRELAEFPRRFHRRVKRLLTQDEKRVLEALRRSTGPFPAALEAADDGEAAFRSEPLVELIAAVRAGAASIPGGREVPDEVVHELCEEFLAELVVPLHRLVATAVESAGSARDHAVDSVRECFRQIKLNRSREMIQHWLHAAYARGVYEAIPNSTMVRWVTLDLAACGAECARNAGETDIAKGEPFPNALARPPAHPRCGCVVVPAG
jgi:cell division septum initiation protein DivIVA